MAVFLLLAACGDGTGDTSGADETSEPTSETERESDSPAIEHSELTTSGQVVRFTGSTTVNYIDWDTGEVLASLPGELRAAASIGSAIAFKAPDGDDRVIAVDGSTGAMLWEWHSGAGMVVGDLEEAAGYLVVASSARDDEGPGVVTGLADDGTVRWSTDLEGFATLSLLASSESETVAVRGQYESGPGVVMIDASTGEVEWGSEARYVEFRGSLVVAQGVSGGVSLWDAEARQELGTFGNGQFIDLLPDGSVVLSSGGALNAIDPTTGETTWTRPIDGRGQLKSESEDFLFGPTDGARPPTRVSFNDGSVELLDRGSFVIGPATAAQQIVASSGFDRSWRDAATEDLFVQVSSVGVSSGTTTIGRWSDAAFVWEAVLPDAEVMGRTDFEGLSSAGIDVIARDGDRSVSGVDRLSGARVWIGDLTP